MLLSEAVDCGALEIGDLIMYPVAQLGDRASKGERRPVMYMGPSTAHTITGVRIMGYHVAELHDLARRYTTYGDFTFEFLSRVKDSKG